MHINPWFWRFSLFCYEPVQHIYFLLNYCTALCTVQGEYLWVLIYARYIPEVTGHPPTIEDFELGQKFLGGGRERPLYLPTPPYPNTPLVKGTVYRCASLTTKPILLTWLRAPTSRKYSCWFLPNMFKLCVYLYLAIFLKHFLDILQ